MKASRSITRRLISTVLFFEVLSAVALIAAITIHERTIRLQAFDVSLKGTAESLMGAVQDAEDEDDNVLLDLRSIQLAKHSIYRAVEKNGKVLGASEGFGQRQLDFERAYQNQRIDGKSYRFYTLHGIRTIDPGKPSGGVRHEVTIVYGSPLGRVWHEIWEAVRFFASATVLLLGLTGLIMVWLIRRELSPIHDLAYEAERVSARQWHFAAPASAKETVELHTLSTALEEALARLQKSFAQQKRFTSDAAHELKTDVAIVKSSLQLLAMRRRSADEYSKGLAQSLDDFIRLEDTVQKMLTLARLEQPSEMSRQHCQFRDALEDVLEQSEPTAELKGITIQRTALDDSPVELDRRDAILLCSNLVLNALQHSPEGSAVWIELHSLAGGMKFSIRDGGPGINDGDRPFLFEPFYRGDPSRSRKSGGTGLGLSICKAICERAGGSIEIANHPTGGAIVIVELPTSTMDENRALSSSLRTEKTHS